MHVCIVYSLIEHAHKWETGAQIIILSLYSYYYCNNMM